MSLSLMTISEIAEWC